MEVVGALGYYRLSGPKRGARAHMWDEFRAAHRTPSTLISYALAIIGLLGGACVSFYFYEKSLKFGEISMAVDELQVFDRDRMGILPLRITDAKGNPVTNNVYVADVTIWNSGTAEIKKDDIRKSLQLTIGNGLKPLDLSVKYSHDNIEHMNVTPDGVIEWDHFDPKEGVKVRLVYTNDTMLPLGLDGWVAGVRDIKMYMPSPSYSRSRVIPYMLAVIGVILGVGFMTVGLIRNWGSRGLRYWQSYFKYMIAGGLIFLVFFVGAIFYSNEIAGMISGPPF
jgi:hypothetical protein